MALVNITNVQHRLAFVLCVALSNGACRGCLQWGAQGMHVVAFVSYS